MMSTGISLPILLFFTLLATSPASAADTNFAMPRIEQPDPDIHDSEPLQNLYESAWSKYSVAIENVREAIARSVAIECEKAFASGDLALVEMWQKAESQFASDGTLSLQLGTPEEWSRKHPHTAFPKTLANSLKAADEECAAAVSRLTGDYNSLVTDYTRLRLLSIAKVMRAELETLGKPPLATAPVERVGTIVLQIALDAKGNLVISRRTPGQSRTMPGVTRKKQPDGTWLCDYDCANVQKLGSALRFPSYNSYNPALWAYLLKPSADPDAASVEPLFSREIRTPFDVELEIGELADGSGLTVSFWGPYQEGGSRHDVDVRLDNQPQHAGGAIVSVSAGTLSVKSGHPMLDRNEILSVPWNAADQWRRECQLPRPDFFSRELYGPGLQVNGKKPVSVARIRHKGRLVPDYGLAFKADGTAIVVSHLKKGYAASKSGILEGDMVLAIGGTRPGSVRNAVQLLRDTSVGEPCKIEIQRAGKVLEFQINDEWGDK